MVNILPIDPGERVSAMIRTDDITTGERFLVMVTRSGTIKRLPGESLRNLRSNGIRAITLDEGDELISVRETDGGRKLLIATRDGSAICFDENDVRPTGRGSMGVRGIRLREGDYVIGAGLALPGTNVLSITEFGYGKQTPVEEYRITARGGLGIKNYGLTEKTGKVVDIQIVDGSEDLMVLTEKGILLRTAVSSIKTCGRSTQGVIVMRFKEEDDQVISIALAEHEEETEEQETKE